MYDIESQEENKRRGWVFSLTIHALIILLALLPWFKFQDPPPQKEGILVSFGAPDMGRGDSRPKTQNQVKTPPKPPSENIEESKPQTTPPPRPQTQTTKEVVTADNSDEVSIQKKQEQQRREQEIQEKQRQQQAEEEAKRKAEEAKAKQKAEYEKSKDQFGDLFGGSGKGKTDKPGNQGDPNGDPDATNLEGISTGSGRIGGGLGGRGVMHEPTVKDNSQKTGKVVVKVCVGSSGNVVSADFTQRGSTTTDTQLINIATDAARKYRFSSSDITKQCGTITFDFKLR